MAGMPWPGAVAVSGGGDSLALMHLLAAWARRAKAVPPLVLSVDHGLRPQSAGEISPAVKLGLMIERPTPRSNQLETTADGFPALGELSACETIAGV